MCISPIPIKNESRLSLRGKEALKWFTATHDCESQYLLVPCGHCKECISLKQMFIVQRAVMEAHNTFVFFSTLTYNNDCLPSLTTSSGYDYRFADISDLQKMFKCLRKNNTFGRPFRYLAVSERGSERGRPHFHILWFLKMFPGETFSDGLSLQSLLYTSILHEWRRNIGSTRSPVYRPLCTFARKFYRGKLHTNYDTHFVVPSLTSAGISSVVFYVCKYMFKDDEHSESIRKALKLNLAYDEYRETFALVRSRYVASRSFGYGFLDNRPWIEDYIRQCISISDKSKPLPSFFIPDSPVSFPLCPLYRSNGDIFPASSALEFSLNQFVYDDRSIDDLKLQIQDFDRIKNIIDKDLSIQFNFLFE